MFACLSAHRRERAKDQFRFAECSGDLRGAGNKFVTLAPVAAVSLAHRGLLFEKAPWLTTPSGLSGCQRFVVPRGAAELALQ